MACEHGEETQKLTGLWQVAQNAGWFLPHKNICWIAERHNVLNRDEQGRLHCENGPALSYPDGFSIWAIHGVRVPQYVIEDIAKITVADIQAETNAEIRRVKIDRYGAAKYLADAGAKEIHRDDFGVLRRIDIPGDEPLLMVEVVNSTPEPDGTFKNYSLRVQPELRPLQDNNQFGEPQELTARNAVASTFGMRGENYAPEMQT